MARRGLGAWVFAYAVLVAYGTLFPLVGWRFPAWDEWARSFLALPTHLSRSDLLTNALVYVPLGWGIAVMRLRRGAGSGEAVLAAGALGGLWSLGLEFLQTFLPARVSSVGDLVLNVFGSVVGAGLAVQFCGDGRAPGALGRWARRFRNERVEPGPRGDGALVALGLWAGGQLFPFAPSIDVGDLKHGLRPLYYTLRDPVGFHVGHAAEYALAVLAIGLIWASVARGRRAMLWLGAGVAGVLLGKVPVVGRQLSAEALAGAAVGWLAAWRLSQRRPGPLLTGATLVGFVLVAGLRPGTPPPSGFHGIEWVPFRAQMTSLGGLVDLAAGAWPYYALGWLAAFGGGGSSKQISGGLGIVALALAVEVAQQWIPGRVPDATDALVALLAWHLAWVVARKNGALSGPRRKGS